MRSVEKMSVNQFIQWQATVPTSLGVEIVDLKGASFNSEVPPQLADSDSQGGGLGDPQESQRNLALGFGPDTPIPIMVQCRKFDNMAELSPWLFPNEVAAWTKGDWKPEPLGGQDIMGREVSPGMQVPPAPIPDGGQQ